MCGCGGVKGVGVWVWGREECGCMGVKGVGV